MDEFGFKRDFEVSRPTANITNDTYDEPINKHYSLCS